MKIQKSKLTTKEYVVISLYIVMAILEITKIILKVIKMIEKEKRVIIDNE